MLYLLEKLACPVAEVPGPAIGGTLRDAVRRQIERVVCSHFWPGAPGLQLMGMNLPPLAGFGYAAGADVERYCAGLHALLLRHEPRLEGPRVDVTATGSPLMPYQVAITGRLPGGGEAVESFRFPLPRRD
jgi:hypothetical protein